MTHQPETARELLHRHGLPEDIIDGALCLHAQELAALQRLRMDELDLTGQKARIVGRIVDLIDPTRTPAAVSAAVAPPTDRAAVLHEAADALGCMDYDTDSNDYGYDTYRDAWNGGVMDAADRLRRMADETATETPAAPHPPHDSWLVEWRADGGDWNVAYPTHDHAKALDRLARGRQDAPDWQWRIVRETTTYTVEQPAAGARQDETATETPAPDDRRLHACIEFGTWFDRSVCAEPCGAMHTRCTECGVALDTCPQQPAAGARQDGAET